MRKFKKKMLVSYKFLYDKNKETDTKYSNGYETVKKMRPLCITLLQMNAYLNKAEKAQYMSFVIKDEKLREIYKLFWNRTSNIKQKK